MKKSVCIIGAGTIGLVLAKALASSGIEVDVYESKAEVSDGAEKASGIISKTGLERIGVAYKDSVINELNGATLHSDREKLVIKSKDTKAYVIDRRKYVEECLHEAQHAGAKVYMRTRFDQFDMMRLKNQYDVVVGADGAVSTVAKAFRFPPISSYILTYKAEYSGAKVDDSKIVELFFDNMLTRNFFGWSVPYGHDVVELGLGIDSKYRRNSKAVFEDFKKKQILAESIVAARPISGHASMIPLEARKRTVNGNVLLVGDSAGQTKATTGGGVVFGTGCAMVAANSIVGYIERGEPLTSYERNWRRKYGMELYLHRKIHGLYSSSTPARMDRIFRMVRRLRGEKFFSLYGDMDRPSVMIKRLIFRSLIGD